MPNGNGLELLEAITKIDGENNYFLRVFRSAFSGTHSDLIRVRNLFLNGNLHGLIRKPYDLDEITQLMHIVTLTMMHPSLLCEITAHLKIQSTNLVLAPEIIEFCARMRCALIDLGIKDENDSWIKD